MKTALRPCRLFRLCDPRRGVDPTWIVVGGDRGIRPRMETDDTEQGFRLAFSVEPILLCDSVLPPRRQRRLDGGDRREGGAAPTNYRKRSDGRLSGGGFALGANAGVGSKTTPAVSGAR